MSFTAPLWNELVFEKINELHASHQEVMKHLSQLSIRIIHLENRLVTISNGVGHIFAHFNNRKTPSVEQPNEPVTASAPASSSVHETVPVEKNILTTVPIAEHVKTASSDEHNRQVEMEKYSNDPDEGEWTKVSRKRK